MAEIRALEHSESVRLDPDRLGCLFRQLGPVAAEDVICRAIEELAVRLSHCGALHQRQDRDGLRKTARSLVAIAEQVGMTALARSARDVAQTLDQPDPVATEATLCRLLRIGERSLTAIWDLQDLSV